MFCRLDVRKATINTILQQAIDEAIVKNVKGRKKYELVDNNYTVRINNFKSGKSEDNPKLQAEKIANNLVKKINAIKPELLRVVKKNNDDFSPVTLEVFVNPDFIEKKFQELPEEKQNNVEVDLQRDLDFFNGDKQLQEQEDGFDDVFYQLNIPPNIIKQEREKFQKEGITLNQKSNIPIISKLLYKAVTPATYDKTAIAKKALTSIVFGRSYEDFKDLVKDWDSENMIPGWAKDITKEQYLKREDAWLLSNGLPQKHNTFKYIGRGFIENNKVVLDVNGEDIYDFNAPVFNDVDINNSLKRKKTSSPDSGNFVMGNYGLSTGRDTIGYFLKYTDRWDLDINNNIIQKTIDITQNPFIVTGKLYKAASYDENGNIFDYYTSESNNPDIDVYTQLMAELETEEIIEEDKKEYIEQKASPQLIKLIKEFIKQIGVDYKLVENITVNGVKQDVNGVALIMQKLIQVVEGKEEQALPEEAMHFAVEIIQQTNPKLFQQLLKEINNTETYKQVLDGYSSIYKTKDGKPDILKLKKEAIAKALVNSISDELAKSWWDKIKDFLNNLFFAKSGISQATLDVINGKIENINNIDISEGGEYFQLSKGEEVFNNFNSVQNKLELKEDGTFDEEGEPKKSYFIDGVKLKRRVSDRVSEWYKQIFGESNVSEYQESLNTLKAEKGTAKHKQLEDIQNLFVDKSTGLLRETFLEDEEYISTLSAIDLKIYNKLKENLKQRLLSFPEGTRFMSEVKIADVKRSLAGTIDFIAITKEGKVTILDWKFVDLNVDKYEDIPWYKVKAWNMQMSDYKSILSNSYGIKSENFQQTRMIPIQAIYSTPDYENEILPKLLGINIGDVDTTIISEDFLLPVALPEETTGDKEIDNVLEKFNSVYEKLTTQKVKNDDEKQAKAEQLNSLYKAIRHLQIKKNIIPLINQSRILTKTVNSIIDKYKKDISVRENITNEEKEAFAGLIRLNLEALDTYLNLDDLDFLLQDDTEQNEKLKIELNKTVKAVKNNIKALKNIDEEFGKKFIGTSYTPEKVINGITKFFSGTSTLQSENIQMLYRLATKAFGLATQENFKEVAKLTALKSAYEKWASARNLSKKDYFKIIMKDGKNELVDQYSPEFYKMLKQKISQRDYNWIRENIDVESYKKFIEEKVESEILRIKNTTRHFSDEQNAKEISIELAKMFNKYSLKEDNSNGWLLNQYLLKFPIAKWETEKWQELNKPQNSPAKDFYNYIVDRNKYYVSVGYLSGKSYRKFLPFVQQGLVESAMFSGKRKAIGEGFLRGISLDENETGYGQTDPVTGEIINKVPKYFLNETEDGYSTDLFKTITLYNEFAIKYKNLSAIEEQAAQLLRAERNKKSIKTSKFGVAQQKNGNIEYNKDNLENSELLESMIKAIVYQQKYVESNAFDANLGRIGNLGKKLNDKLGLKGFFPEDLSGRYISLNKTVDQLNKNFQLATLGLNVLSATSNFFGGQSQGLINSGKYFTKTDFMKKQAWMISNKMKGGEDAKKYLAALDYFMPFVDNYNRDAAKNLSLMKIDEQGVQDYIMWMMRKGEESVQKLNFFAFLDNAVIVDDKIVNSREYLKSTDEYKQFYKGSQSERKARAEKFEKDVATLNSEKGVMKLARFENGKMIIPGIEQSDDSVLNFTAKVQQFTTDALGTLSPANKRLINLNIWGSSFMVFKNWIPRLIDVRMGNIKYNAASEAYEWGRMRMLFNIVGTDILGSIKSLKSAIAGNDDVWLEQIRNLYEAKREEYLNNTGKELKMTEDQFIELVNQNIKNQATDLIVLLIFASMLALLKANAPDDEDDLVRNQYNFFVKATDKLTDEILYFYNPGNLVDLVGRGVLPSLGLLGNYSKFLSNFLKENYGIIVQDDKITDDAKPIKYLMKSFPITNQTLSILPLFYPEVAKDLGVKVTSNYGIVQ